MAYMQRRDGEPTGKWIGERVIAGKRTRFVGDKKRAEKWERYVDATGHPPMDGSCAAPSVRYPLGLIAERAKRERVGWKGGRDPRLGQRLEAVLAYFKPTSAPEDMTPEKLSEFVVHLEDTRTGRDGGPISSKTINRYLSVASGLLDFARRLRWSAHAPTFPWQEELDGRLHFFTADMEDKLLSLLRPVSRLVYRALLQTGMRAGELWVKLEPSMFDFSGKGSAFLRFAAEDVKGKREEALPIERALAKALKRELEAGTLPTYMQFYRELKGACASLGFSEELTVHSIRHTTGSRSAQKFSGPRVKNFMRHRSYKTTERYIHMFDEDRAEVGEALHRPLTPQLRTA